MNSNLAAYEKNVIQYETAAYNSLVQRLSMGNVALAG